MHDLTDTVARLERHKRISDLAAEHAALDYVEMRARIADLESDCKTYKMLAVAGLECIAQLTARNKQLACRIDHLNGQLRELMGCAKESRMTQAREDARRTIAAMRRRQVSVPANLEGQTEPSWTM
jgi:hypothetical protein